MRPFFTFCFFFFISVLCIAQDSIRVHTAGRLDSKIKIDATLDEQGWEGAAVSSDFIQFDPLPGKPASYNTEVRVVYDDEALYIGGLLRDPEPDKILKQLSPRDDRDNTSWFSVTIDPYQSTQLGFAFIVSAAGVQQDLLVTPTNDDTSWNAVWDSAVRITDEGWVVELKIPYAAIRFPDVPVQSWGIQFGREIRRFRERSFWSETLPTVNGFLTQFGTLEGIRDIKPPLRLQFTPFAIGYYDVASPQDGSSTTDLYYSAGMDVKYGINDAFTLDMTLIPDFGQVQSDNNVLNLSPFEVFFEEQRQFFTEGIELFEKADLFYSRRIGGTPVDRRRVQQQLVGDEEIMDNPTVTRLYNASKVSGRTAGGLGIGVLNAVSAPTRAVVQNSSGETREIQTAPLTNYNVLVFDQNLRANSSITLTNTNVWRIGSTYDANVTGLNWDLKDLKQRYSVEGNLAVSQRYDIETDLGYQYNLSLNKVSGNFTGELGYFTETDRYDHNDLGFLQANNERIAYAGISYNDYEPRNKAFQRWRYYLEGNYQMLYAPDVFTDMQIDMGTFYLFQSRDAFGVDISINPVTGYDYFEPRSVDFSARMANLASYSYSAFISSDYRKVLALDARYTRRDFMGSDRWQQTVRFAPRIRFSDKLFTTVSTEYTSRNLRPGYVSKALAGPALVDLAGGILMGERARDIIESVLNVEYIFNDKMSLTTRVRHYWDRVEYQNFGWLQDDGLLSDLDYTGIDESGSAVYDRNFNIFNIDMVYTWRFAPGSDIIIVWKNNISKGNDAFDRNYVDNLLAIGEGNQFDSFSVRVIYFLDYLNVKKLVR